MNESSSSMPKLKNFHLFTGQSITSDSESYVFIFSNKDSKGRPNVFAVSIIKPNDKHTPKWGILTVFESQKAYFKRPEASINTPVIQYMDYKKELTLGNMLKMVSG